MTTRTDFVRVSASRILNKRIAIYLDVGYDTRMLNLTYEYKLIPTDTQRKTFDHWLEICRKVYNFTLRERKDWINSRKCDINSCSFGQEYILPADAPRPTFARQCKKLAEAKKTIAEFKLPHTHVLQQVLRQLEAALVSMWERGYGFPRFKKRMRSFVFPQLNLELVREFDGSWEVNLPKIGWVKVHRSRPIPVGFGMLCKHALDAGFGQFLNILGHVCFKQGKYFVKVDANGTSQTCPRCQTHTGKKLLSERVHKCHECGYKTNRDVAAAQIVLQRGYTAVGRIAVNFGEGK